MEKKVYNVYLYYHGCINDKIAADSEEEATAILRERVDHLNSQDFISSAGIIEDGCDIYGIGEVIREQ